MPLSPTRKFVSIAAIAGWSLACLATSLIASFAFWAVFSEKAKPGYEIKYGKKTLLCGFECSVGDFSAFHIITLALVVFAIGTALAYLLWRELKAPVTSAILSGVVVLGIFVGFTVIGFDVIKPFGEISNRVRPSTPAGAALLNEKLVAYFNQSDDRISSLAARVRAIAAEVLETNERQVGHRDLLVYDLGANRAQLDRLKNALETFFKIAISNEDALLMHSLADWNHLLYRKTYVEPLYETLPEDHVVLAVVKQIIVEMNSLAEDRVELGARFVEDLGFDELDEIETGMELEQISAPALDAQRTPTLREYLIEYETWMPRLPGDGFKQQLKWEVIRTIAEELGSDLHDIRRDTDLRKDLGATNSNIANVLERLEIGKRFSFEGLPHSDLDTIEKIVEKYFRLWSAELDAYIEYPD